MNQQQQTAAKIDPRLRRAAARGNTVLLETLLAAADRHILLGATSADQDTALHIALRNGHVKFARAVLGHRQAQLPTRANAKGDTPLHCALMAGNPEFVVECLRRHRIALNQSPPTVNGAGKSLVYLAAERGFLEAVRSLIGSPLGDDVSGPDGSTALHAAALLTSHDSFTSVSYFNKFLVDSSTIVSVFFFPLILRELIDHRPQLKHQADGKGNTPLHYAALVGNLWAFHLLVDEDASSPHVLNNDGFSPLHLTAILGNLRAFECLFRWFPESVWVTSANGRKNVLHLSVKEGKANVVKFIVEKPELRELMYEPDEEENTPLHLATSESPGMLHIFMEIGIVFPSIKNRDNVTVIDIGKQLSREARERKTEKIRESQKKREDLVSSLLVVAGLIITVTFTAAFTMPGGYGSNRMANLAAKPEFKVFLILDTISMCSSITAAAALIMFSLNSSNYQQARILQLAALEVGISILSMLVAFAAGACIVTGPLSFWLAFIVTLGILCAPLFCFVMISEIMFRPEVEDMSTDDMSVGKQRFK